MNIPRRALFGKLNLDLFRAIESATAFAKLRGNPYVELVHWLHQIWQIPGNDLHRLASHHGLDDVQVERDLTVALAQLPSGAVGLNDFSHMVELAIERAWVFASLTMGDSCIRGAWLLGAMLQTPELRRLLLGISASFQRLPVALSGDELLAIVGGSGEARMAAHDASELSPAVPGEASGAWGASSEGGSALSRYCTDLTALARSGGIDPVVGREQEIRTMADILLRRRQNNPLLTGEAGVGKTAVVEGLARAIAADKVPPSLREVRVLSLDVGMLLAGASMRGEFEARLKAVLKEAGDAAVPVILFVDEVHTLVGAGGQAGTGDAANLLKPALARGAMRVIGATTWSEYKKHIERDDDAQTMAHAALLRARLGELREHLGIRFPVYVVLTKTDLLRGFAAYFSSLTTEARAQVWGFTLPWRADDKGAESVAERIGLELTALQRRVADGVATRLQEEFELDRRQALYVLPQELRALIPRLQALLDAVFCDSRYDTTQATHALRGVYFTSAMQYDDRQVTADRRAVIPRLRQTLAGIAAAGDPTRHASSARSFFLGDALSKVVFPEAHLVKPNLRWEARFRLLRLAGHALVLVLFGWLTAALMLSHANNRAYLTDVAAKTRALAAGMDGLGDPATAEKMVEVLGMTQALPAHPELDLAAPSLSYQYGLYAAAPVVDAALVAYGHLQDRLILPVITRRMEAVMRAAVQAEDSKSAYDALHVYLLLHDRARYAASPTGARVVRDWIVRDWQQGAGGSTAAATPSVPPARRGAPPIPASDPGLAAAFGNSAAMVGYLEDMFSGKRVVQAMTVQDEALIRQVRGFLDGSSSSERLYQRTKAALMPDAPQDFTLVRALGPQVGTLFGRASGETLEKGVPGFFTYDGYHTLFARRLPDMVAVAMVDDAWVMGRTDGPGAPQKAMARSMPAASEEAQALIEDIRRQYLIEYADRWTAFLADIRVIGAQSGGSLAFELNVLRQLAAPDSPLTRLGRLAARETTLSRSLKSGGEDSKSLFDKAAEQVEKKAAQVSQDLGLRPEQRAQRELVDERFAALREVVTGQSEGVAQPGAKPALDGISNLLNEYYTALVVADAAISTGALPPAGVEAATKIRIEAGKLPAPFREVLLGISANGSDKVAQGAAAILRVQAQAQMDRLVGLLALNVGEPCRRNIAGRYPFAASAQEVAVDDFNAMFATGGAADEYFDKYLAPLVDTSARPWKYKNPALANALVGTEHIASGQPPAPVSIGPTLTGELLKLLVANGPDPDFFARVREIRETYFKEPGAKRMAWKLDVSVQTLEASITELSIDLDGQVQRYAHGPVQALPVQWPGPRGGTMAEIGVQPRIRTDTSVISVRGPWALLRLMERGHIVSGADGGRVAVEFQFDGRRVVLDVGSSGINPLSSPLLRNFDCPSSRSAA